MFEVGRRVRIRERVWQVLEDHADSASADHVIRVRLVEAHGTEHAGDERTFVYHAGATVEHSGEVGAEGDVEPIQEQPIELVAPLAAPELQWNPATAPSQWQRLHMAYRLSIAHNTTHLLGLARSRLAIEEYQLAPVLRVMSAPRQRFLLAEDVGMGKTIEAGLITMELIARGRSDRVLIVTPAALQDQWADEMRDKFGLRFDVLDSEYLAGTLIPRLPSGANPWQYVNRVITSVDFAKQERILRALKKTRWDLIIVDEAHYLAESGSDSAPVRTDRSRFGESLAALCESLLLLTATPHNGYSQGFYSLLRLLDDTRFASPDDLRREAVEQVVVRRSKQSIYTPSGQHKFTERTVHHLELSMDDPTMTSERQLYDAVSRYVSRHWRSARGKANERATVGFAMTILRKRLISSLGAIRASLRTRFEGLTDEPLAPDARRGLLASYRAGVPLTEAQRERVERQLVTLTPERGAEALARERREVERLLKLAEAITPEHDGKAALLKRTLDRFCFEQGRKVIVFTEYKDTLDYLQEYLEARGYAGRIATLHGSLNRSARLAAERQFHQPETLVLLATDAASEGLNFQHGCWTVIHNELPWNPNRLEQRNGRVDRWGQTHNVEIYNCILADTLEGAILKRLDEKLQRIRDELGNSSDVLSVTGPLDLDTLLMDGAEAHATTAQAVDAVDAQVDAALREGREALEACRAQFLIAPGAFGPRDYEEVRAAEAETARALPHPDEIEEFATETIRKLGGVAERVADQPHRWRITPPSRLRRPGVREQYDAATFSREIALADHERPPAVEYIALGHPLLDALVAAVKADTYAGGALAGRMATRVTPRGRGAGRGMLFTYLGRWLDGRGMVAMEEIIPVFLALDGAVATGAQAAALLATPSLTRNAPPALLAVYAQRFMALRDAATAAAIERCQRLAERALAQRQQQLDLLRRDLEVWAEARLAWVQRQLARRAQQEAEQLSLFDGDRNRAMLAASARRENDLKREREVIAQRRREREREITEMQQITPATPELIGALAIVPEEEL